MFLVDTPILSVMASFFFNQDGYTYQHLETELKYRIVQLWASPQPNAVVDRDILACACLNDVKSTWQRDV